MLAPQSTVRQRWHIVFNRDAGTAIGSENTNELFSAVAKELMMQHTNSFEFSTVEGDELPDRLKKAAADRPDVLVVAGGDGTISLAASLVRGTGIALGVIPMGTMNLLARDLDLPLDPIEAASALAQADEHWIDVAEVNGHPFVCSSVLGVVPRLAQKRERARARPFWQAGPDFVKALVSILSSYPMRRLKLDTESGSEEFTTPFVAVSNNPYTEAIGSIPVHDRLDRGRLALYVSRSHRHWRIPLTLLGILSGAWAWDPAFEQIDGKRFRLHAHQRKRFRVMNDGELMTLDSPLEYTIDPQSLKVLVPSKKDETSD